MPHALVETAESIADTLLFPTAIETDASEAVSLTHLDALAEAGLYGMAVPPEFGGAGVDIPTATAIIERLAGGCLSTTFVWIQHQTPVRELSSSPNQALRREWLPEMARGRLRAGIALGGLHQGSAGLKAQPSEGGWLVSGEAPYVTGWGRIDVALLAALTPDGQALRALIDAVEGPHVTPNRLNLVAANASATVRLKLDRLFVPEERVTSLTPYTPPPAHDGGGRPNGSLALGVARRCLALIGPSGLDSELDARRAQLDTASEETMAEARAAAAELAVRAASTLIVSGGSRSILLEDHAQRLYREAAFLLVFGTRTAIKTHLLRHLRA